MNRPLIPADRMHCTHYVPGRLHINYPPLEENEPMAQALQDDIGAIKGILAVEARPLTGSLIIEFDHFQTCPATIFRAIVRKGYGVDKTPPMQQESEGAGEAVVEKVAEAVVEKAAETAVEKAAEAVVGKAAGAVIGALL